MQQHCCRRCCSRDVLVKKIVGIKRLLDDLKVTTAKSVWNGIGVNTGDSKLMLLGINLQLLLKVNAAKHKLTTSVKS
ncbi:hypothetical protein Tco_0611029 [Tanacetum coccineum]